MSFNLNPLVAVIVALVASERLVELRISERHRRLLLTEGGVEVGAQHYPLIVALHAAWLGAIIIRAPVYESISWFPLGLFVCLQPIRIWILLSLGKYWTTRVITVPNAPLIKRGPYRYFSHPNYILVAAEIALLPLAFGEEGVALIFSVLNAVLMIMRLSVETPALSAREDLFEKTPHRHP